MSHRSRLHRYGHRVRDVGRAMRVSAAAHDRRVAEAHRLRPPVDKAYLAALKGSPYRSGRSHDWLKMKNPTAPAVKREADEDWGRWSRRKANL